MEIPKAPVHRVIHDQMWWPEQWFLGSGPSDLLLNGLIRARTCVLSTRDQRLKDYTCPAPWDMATLAWVQLTLPPTKPSTSHCSRNLEFAKAIGWSFAGKRSTS